MINFDIHSIYLAVRDKTKYNIIINDVLFIKQAIINKCRNNSPYSIKDWIIKLKNNTYDYTQHCYKFNELIGRYDKYNIRKLVYKNSFDLINEYDLTLRFIGPSWDLDFWLMLLPKFQMKPEEIDAEMLNNLIAIYTECVRYKNRDNRIDGKLVEDRWDLLDKFILNLNKELEINNDGTIQYNDKLFNYFVTLTSGEVDFFKKTEEFLIYIPLYNQMEHAGNKNLLKQIYTLFKEDQFKNLELIKILTHNFIKDRNPIGLKLAPKSRFADPDNELILTNKITNLITNRSDRTMDTPIPYIMMIDQLNHMLDYHIENDIVIKSKEEALEYYKTMFKENDHSIEFRYLPNYQCSTKNAVAISILSELYYNDRIKLTLNTRTSTMKSYDQLITKAIKAIDDNFIGSDNPEIIRMFKFFKLPCESTNKITVYISGSYINTQSMERYKNIPQFKEWMNKNKIKIHDYCWNEWIKMNNIENNN